MGYAGVKYAHKLFLGHYTSQFRKFMEGWEFMRDIPIRAVAAAIEMAARLLRIHRRF